MSGTGGLRLAPQLLPSSRGFRVEEFGNQSAEMSSGASAAEANSVRALSGQARVHTAPGAAAARAKPTHAQARPLRTPNERRGANRQHAQARIASTIAVAT